MKNMAVPVFARAPLRAVCHTSSGEIYCVATKKYVADLQFSCREPPMREPLHSVRCSPIPK